MGILRRRATLRGLMILVACAAVWFSLLARRERFRLVCLDHHAAADRLAAKGASSLGWGAGSPEFYREIMLSNAALMNARAFDWLMAACVLVPCVVAGISLGWSIRGHSPISRGLAHDSR